MKNTGVWLRVMLAAAVCFSLLSLLGTCKNEKPAVTEEQEEFKRMMRMDNPTSDDLKLSDKITPIQDPKPTHFESQTPHTELEKIVEISTNIDDEHFMVFPWFITPDDQGNIYVTDIRLKKIFKFTKTGQYITSFGQAGFGPGDLGDVNAINEIYFNSDGRLHVSDYLQQRITCFSREGKYITDYKIRVKENTIITFIPAVSPAGEIFVRTGMKSTLDAYKLDGNVAEYQYSLLGREFFSRTVAHRIRVFDEIEYRSVHDVNVNYHVMADGRLMVYLNHVSELLIYNRDVLEKRCYLWPEKALKRYLKAWNSDLSNRGNKYYTPRFFIMNFFDPDEDGVLYLSGHALIESEKDRTRFNIYKFNREGRLLKIYYTLSPSFFRCTKNGLFYGFGKERVDIFRPKE